MATARTTARTRTAGRRAVKPRARKKGVITGINHLVLICKDMEETMRFYCGILGMKAKVSLSARTPSKGTLQETPREYDRFYWLELPNGDSLAMLEVPDLDTTADSSYFNVLWPVPRQAPPAPRKMDHLAFNVDTVKDLEALRSRLEANDWPVSEVQDLPQTPFVKSIYFYDPNGVPLEAATYNFGGSEWKGRTEADWYRDEDPPPFARTHGERSWKVPARWHRTNAPRR